MIADEHNVNDCMANKMITQDLNMREMCAKVVSKDLNDDQKSGSKKVSAEMF
jgi:hypothetical protein